MIISQWSWQRSIAVIVCVVFVAFGWMMVSSARDTESSSAQSTIVSLNGPWQFYWDELLTPEDLVAGAHTGATIAVPSSWVGQVIDPTVNGGQPLPRFGVATYRLQTAVPAVLAGKQLLMLLGNIGSAHRVWVNGVEQDSLGIVATIQDGQVVTPETPVIRLRFIDIPSNTTQLDIIVQVSNYTFRDSGIFGDVRIGDTYDTMMFLLERYVVRELLLLSFIFLMGLYHVIIYVTSRRDISLLWLAGVCFGVALRAVFINKFLFDVLFPNIAWDTVMRLQYSAKFFAQLSYIGLVYVTIRSVVPQRVHHFAMAVTCAWIVYVWVMPVGAYTLSLLQQTVVMVIVLAYYATMSVLLMVRQRTLEAKLNVASQVGIIVAIFHDYFLFPQRFDSIQLVLIAMLAMLLLQAIIISLRYALFQQQNEQLTEGLKEANRTLEYKVRERTEALDQSNAQLAALFNQRTQLMANIAHDMGSPITGVQSSLYVLTDDAVHGPERQELVTMLHQRVRDLKHLTDGLFHLSMLESRQVEFNWEYVAVADLYAEWSTSFARMLDLQGRVLRVEHVAIDVLDAHATVRVDRRQLQRVMQNLIDNAVKFSVHPQSPIEFNSMVRQVPHHHRGLREWYVEVVDYGVGIEANELSMIFQRFYSGQQQHRGNGSGLGLAITKEIIEHHGGVLSVHSELGRGSTFAFVIPLVD